MIPLSKEEVKKQSLILEFYEAFDKDDFGAYIYESLKSRGLAGGKLAYAPNERDVILTLFYEAEEDYEKEVLYLNVFDVFGEGRHKKAIKTLLHNYYIKIFGDEYKKIQQKYEVYKQKNKIKEYKDGNELLLQPWTL